MASSDEALDEGECGVGDLFPAVVDGQGVSAVLDVLDLGDAGGFWIGCCSSPRLGGARGARMRLTRPGASKTSRRFSPGCHVIGAQTQTAHQVGFPVRAFRTAASYLDKTYRIGNTLESSRQEEWHRLH